MTSIFLKVTGAHAEALVSGTLTSGMVGIPVTMEYDDAWEGLTKNLVCRCARGTDDGEQRTILNVKHSAVVAHEVMQAGMHLYLGVEGVSADGALVIPTVWALCGVVESGTNAGSELSAEPTPTVWEQLQTQINQIECGSIHQEQLEELQGYVDSAARAAQAAAISAGRAEGAASGVAISIGPDVPVGENRPLYWLDTSGDSVPDVPEQPEQPGEPDAPVDPEKTLTGITAVYTGGSVPVGTALTALAGIVVTATYSDGSTEAVTGYTLSGEIAEGSNTITVTYQGKTATFAVTGSAASGGNIDFSEANVIGYTEVTTAGSNSSVGLPYAELLRLDAARIYYYALPQNMYNKTISISASPLSNGQSYARIVNNLGIVSIKAGESDIVVNAYDRYDAGGYVVFEIDVAALRNAVQAKIDDGTLSIDNLSDIGIGTNMCAVGTLYLLRNYEEVGA